MRRFNYAKEINRKITIQLGSLLVLIGIVYAFSRNWLATLIISVLILIGVNVYLFARVKLKEAQRIKKIESAFPDFIELMASNLRAGMTIDQAILLSSRKEFAPLDQEIFVLGKDILTGTEISRALEDTAKRINSDKITKTVELIISGIKSGGNLSTLLEETAQNMRERDFLEKRSASNVLMYVIFIFFAAAIGAPILFALSSVMVNVLTNILSGLPATELPSGNIPLSLTKITISETFVLYFSLTFLTVINILSSLVLGLVSKGEEKEGIRYLPVMVFLGLLVFFTVRITLLKYFSFLFL